MNIAVITGASSGLGVKFLEAVLNKYPNLDEYWIIARRRERLELDRTVIFNIVTYSAFSFSEYFRYI